MWRVLFVLLLTTPAAAQQGDKATCKMIAAGMNGLALAFDKASQSLQTTELENAKSRVSPEVAQAIDLHIAKTRVATTAMKEYVSSAQDLAYIAQICAR